MASLVAGVSDNDDLVLEVYHLGNPTAKGWVRGNCPFCPDVIGKEDNDTSFGIQEGTGWYMCFKCETKGRLKNPPDYFPVDMEYAEHLDNEDRFMEPPSEYIELAEDGLKSMLCRPARRYLVQRGYDDLDLWAHAALGCCLRGRYAGRIIVPIRDEDGRWLGWSARDYTGKQKPKYLYPPDMPRGGLFYEQWLINQPSRDPLIVVEGVFDALPYFGQAVACLGKPTEDHIDLLRQATRPVAMCLDGDAWRTAESVAYRLQLDGVPSGFVRLDPKTDPGDVDPDWLRRAARACITDNTIDC